MKGSTYCPGCGQMFDVHRISSIFSINEIEATDYNVAIFKKYMEQVRLRQIVTKDVEVLLTRLA